MGAFVDKGFDYKWIEELKAKSDIVTTASRYITLAKRGRTWWACCPFHFEKTPSFAINEVEQYYHCFGCGASGDVINFVMKHESLDFYDACKRLAEYAGMELPEFHSDENLVKNKKKRERIYEALLDAGRFYYMNLKTPDAGVALEYLQSRKLDMATVKEFGIGYSTDWTSVVSYLKGKGYSDEEILDAGIADKQRDGRLNDFYGKRLIFPIFNLYGNIVGFSGRVLGKTDFAKYKNTPQTLVFDKSKCIYGIKQLKKLKTEGNISEIVLVEGQMDVISLYKAGIRNAVACMGTALTPYHAKDLKKFSDKVVLSFDGDSAGKKATLRSIEILVKAGLMVYIVTIPNGHDPDEYVNMFGKDSWDKLISSAKYWVEFLIRDFATNYNLDKLDEKSRFIGDALGVIRKLDSASEQEIYLKMVEEITGVKVAVLKADLQNGTNDTIKQEDIAINKPNNQPNLKDKENGYVKAVKFVISAMLYKKDYATINMEIRDYILNPDYVKIFDYVVEEKNAGKTPIVSKLFDMFDVENSEDIADIINYEFIESIDNEQYYSGCVDTILKNGLIMQKDKLLSEMAKTEDTKEKYKILKKIQEITLKEKKK